MKKEHAKITDNENLPKITLEEHKKCYWWYMI